MVNERLKSAFEYANKLKEALIDTPEKRMKEAERKMIEKYENLEKKNQEKYNKIFY